MRKGHIAPTRLFVPFSLEEHASYATLGSNRIEGQAFLRQRDGAVVTCAGSTVTISPATDFSREVLAFIRAAGNLTLHPTAKTAFENLARTEECDAQGNFAVSDLPAGRWIVTVTIEWSVGRETQGGILQREVQLPSSDRLFLNDQHFISPVFRAN